MKKAALVTVLIGASSLFAKDIYVNNVTGKDANNGSAPDSAFGTINKAIDKAGPGDTIHLANTGKLYRQSANFMRQAGGKPDAPVTLDGHGAMLSGADIFDPANWTEWKDGVYKSTKQVSNVFMLLDGKMNFKVLSFNALKPGQFCYMPDYFNRLYFYPPDKKKAASFVVEVGQPDGSSVKLDPKKWGYTHSRIGAVRRYQGLKKPTWVKLDGKKVELITAKESLAPGEWCREDKTMYFRLPAGKKVSELKIESIIRGNGVFLSGTSKYIVVKNMNVQHVYNDGYNIHGAVTNAEFYNCNARQCGDEGFSAHDKCETLLDGAVYTECDNGIANVNLSGSSITRNVIITDSRHVGYMIQSHKTAKHTLENAIFINNPSQVSVADTTVKNMLIIRTNPKMRTNALGCGRNTVVSNATIVGNSRLIRLDKKSNTTFDSLLVGPNQYTLHVRFDDPAKLLKIENSIFDDGTKLEWGSRYPWKTMPIGQWLAKNAKNSKAEKLTFQVDLLKGKMPANLPAAGCSKALLEKYVKYVNR